ncbi:hypothetical protein JTE90_015168 [Oedothorax gibbosus]|uniref:Uncharacterized protein n=1 Tax=Oedothorax gibbosus TaxID=931172 RepID=A0AAV6V8W4_9ARAC|nr:hypothetical protein JTE90_015168 [Oedothorax gibbosus]
MCGDDSSTRPPLFLQSPVVCLRIAYLLVTGMTPYREVMKKSRFGVWIIPKSVHFHLISRAVSKRPVPSSQIFPRSGPRYMCRPKYGAVSIVMAAAP